MEKKSTLFHLLTVLIFTFSSTIGGFSQIKKADNSLNPGLEIPDTKVEQLDGEYSVVKVDNGIPRELSIKFNKGQIVSVFMNGQEIPRENWNDYRDTITEYVEYIEQQDPDPYKYKEWYQLEQDLKNDFNKLYKQIKDLEVPKKLKMFYNEEMRDWIEDLEKEINNSVIIQDLEEIFDELMIEIDEFLSERKEYLKEVENQKDI
jgi:hypothetical protein